MRVLRRLPGVVFMGFADEREACALELVETKNEDVDLGNAYAQIAVSCEDVYEAARSFEEKGVNVVRLPGPVPGIGTKICAVRDPDGWKTVLVDALDFDKEFDQ